MVAKTPPGRRCARGPRERLAALAGAVEQLDELHRREHRIELGAEVELLRVGLHRDDVERGARCAIAPARRAVADRGRAPSRGARAARGAVRRGRCRNRCRAPRRPGRVSSSHSDRSASYEPHSTSCQIAAGAVIPRTAGRGRGRSARRAARAARCRSAAHTAGDARCLQGHGRGRCARRGTTSSRSGATPAYFKRRASSSARVPEHIDARGVRGERLEVRVPDPRDVAPVGDPVVQHDPHVEALAVGRREGAEDLVRARGILHEQDREAAVADSDLLGAAEGGRERLEAAAHLVEARTELQARSRRRESRCRRCRGREGAA